MPKSAKDYQELITAKLDEAKAIVALAEQEDRDLTEEDNQQLEAIRNEIGEDGDEPTGLYAQWRRRQKIDALIERDPPSNGKPPKATKPNNNNRIVPINNPVPRMAAKAFKDDWDAYASGQWCAATLFGREDSSRWCRENGVRIHNAQGTDDNAKGGFLVPEQMERAIINLREEYGVFRREAKVVPMASDTMIIPRRTSGLTAYYGRENPSSALTDSDKGWDQVQLTARKLYVLTKWSSELNADAIISIAADLADEIAYQFAYQEDLAGFIGDGTSTYDGIIGCVNALAAGSKLDAVTGNTAFYTLDLLDFQKLVGKLPQYATANAKWYISRPGFYSSMARLQDAGGGNTKDDIAGGNAMQFLGYPVVISQVLNSTLGADTSKPKVLFGDLRMAATMGTRNGVSLLTSEHAYFEYDQLAIRGTERFDINIHETGDASNAGALVLLSTPGS
jgi:HK97 family phage major capsid protein